MATYWIDVLRALARPDSYLRQVAPAGNINEDWWLGGRDPRPRGLSDAPCRAGSATSAVEDIATFAQSRIDALYERVAAESGRADAPFFAEKLRNDVVSDLAWELYPDAREIVLVRDPRDVLCSILAANRKRGDRPPPDDVAELGRTTTSRRASPWSPRAWSAGASARVCVRYEDLMTDPAERSRDCSPISASRRAMRPSRRCLRAPDSTARDGPPSHDRRSRRVDRPLAPGPRAGPGRGLRAAARRGDRCLWILSVKALPTQAAARLRQSCVSAQAVG